MRALLVIFVLLFGVFTVAYLYQDDMLPVKQIQIDGDIQHIDLQLVEQTLLPYVDHGLLTVDVGGLQQALMTIPWVAQASVSRIWPDTVHIVLAEPKAVALWSDNGIVSEEGRVYYLPSSETLPDLPVFEGLEGEASRMLERYQRMQLMLAPYQRHINRIVLSPRQAWEVQLDNGMILRLGQQDILKRLERFLSVYPQIAEEAKQDINYVDMRYPNGLAIRYHEESENP